MKRITILIIIFFGCTSFIGDTTSSTYSISEIYSGVEPQDSDTKVITSSGELEEVSIILIPTKLDIGKYKIEVTKKAPNIYRIEGTKIYLETKYCYEYANRETVFLNITSSYGYSKGDLIFD